MALIEHILKSSVTNVKTLQRFAGKAISFSLAVPGARLFINEVNIAILKGLRSSRPIPVSGHLKNEISHWMFLKTWCDHLPWQPKPHAQIKLASDASSFAWGGILNPDDPILTSRDILLANGRYPSAYQCQGDLSFG